MPRNHTDTGNQPFHLSGSKRPHPLDTKTVRPQQNKTKWARMSIFRASDGGDSKIWGGLRSWCLGTIRVGLSLIGLGCPPAANFFRFFFYFWGEGGGVVQFLRRGVGGWGFGIFFIFLFRFFFDYRIPYPPCNPVQANWMMGGATVTRRCACVTRREHVIT